MSTMNRQWRLARRPQGELDMDVLQMHSEPLAPLQEGEVRVRNLYLSLDPTNRIWMSDMKQYMPPVEIGAVMRGGTLGKVVESRHPGLAAGDIVQVLGNWQDYWTGPGMQASKIPWDGKAPLTLYMGLLGMIGATAYFGMIDICQPQAGDTVVVSGAAGAVGSIAGQIAKIQGARVIGIAGSADKCRWLVDELGFDAAIDYRSEDVEKRLAELAPAGVNAYFENVGGRIAEAVLEHLALGARIALCGLISSYNDREPATGPRNYAMLLMRRATLKGYIISDYMARFPEAIKALAGWYASGKLRYRVDVRDGLEHAPRYLKALFDGSNQGKLIVRVAAEDAT